MITYENTKRISASGYVFEIVDHPPLGYEIWNIPSDTLGDYIPFCRLSEHQPFIGAKDIDTRTLKAMPLKDAHLIVDAIGHVPDMRGHKAMKYMEQYLKHHRHPRKGTIEYTKADLFRRALPVMQKIKWT